MNSNKIEKNNNLENKDNCIILYSNDVKQGDMNDKNIKKIKDYKNQIKMLNKIRASEKEKNNNEIKSLTNKIKHLQKENNTIKIKLNEKNEIIHKCNDKTYNYEKLCFDNKSHYMSQNNYDKRRPRGYSYDKYESSRIYTSYIVPPPPVYNFPYGMTYMQRDIFSEMGLELLTHNLKNNFCNILFGANHFNSPFPYNKFFGFPY